MEDGISDESPVLINRNASDDGRVWVIMINREDVRNSIDYETSQKLAEAMEEFDNDSISCVAVLSSIGSTFCAGADLKALSQDPVRRNPLNPVEEIFTKEGCMDKTGPMGVTRMLTKKPIIAAIRGYAVAGGLEIACWCDLRVCDRNATFGVFCRRVGVPLIDGGTYRLVQLIGLSRAMDLILTGRPVPADEAFEIGLANRVVGERMDVVEYAVQLASDIAAFPQMCLRVDRLNVYNGLGKGWREALKEEFDRGLPIVEKESIQGSHRFIKEGIGKHGSFEKKDETIFKKSYL